MKRTQKFRIQSIQKEQVQLVQIEKTLGQLLGDIKEAINAMKVEELQLKSSLVEHFTNSFNQDEQPTTSAQAAAADAVSSSALLWLNSDQVPEEQAPTAGFIDDSINRQLLDLETLLVPMKKREFSDDEEEDDDEEDDVEMENGDEDDDAVGKEEEEDDEEFLPEDQ